jgi:hypothetical protein
MHCRGSKNVNDCWMLIAGVCLGRRPFGMLMYMLPHGIQQQAQHVQHKRP